MVSWVLYDLANTIFSMGVTSLTFSLWVKDAAGETRADSVYGLITSISMGIIFIISPLLGAMSDRAPRRMPFLIVSTIICVAFTELFGRVGYAGTMIAFVIANAAYQAGLQFYDSLLVEVTTDENRGRIGGIGVGVGYFGSYIAVAISLLIADKTLQFTLYGVSFLLFAIPCFLYVKERGRPADAKIFDPGVLISSTRETIRTLREGKKYPGLLRFLVGRVFYTDAINTVILIMTLYATNLGVSVGATAKGAEYNAKLVMMFAITFAIAGGFMWGRVVDRIGPKKTLDYVLYLWLVTFVLAASMGLVGLPYGVLWGVTALAGVALGGVWSADRPLMLRLTPPDRVGEFYGLYGMVGRFSAITGPLLWAGVTSVVLRHYGLTSLKAGGANAMVVAGQVRVAQGFGVISLMLMVVVSWWILRPVSDAPRKWNRD